MCVCGGGVRVCTGGGAHQCPCLQKLKEDIKYPSSFSALHLFPLQQGSLIKSGVKLVASKPTGFPPSTTLMLRLVWLLPVSNVGAGDARSGLCACTQKLVPAEPSSSLLHGRFL